MTAHTTDIGDIAMQGISLVGDEALNAALKSAYMTVRGAHAAETASSVFRKLTSSHWPVDTVCGFLSGWRATHGMAVFVSGLIVRMLLEAEERPEPARSLIYKSAAELGNIISEDMGVTDRAHSERFEIFANGIVGDNRWQLSRYSQPACEKFRAAAKQWRLVDPIEDAILFTAASEIWNTGEYAFFDSMVRPWIVEHANRRIRNADVEEITAYVSVHTGSVELGHFLHALKAWQLYCEANGRKSDPEKARAVFERYLEAVSDAFEALNGVLLSQHSVEKSS